jgi:hypothetical protein
MWSWRPAPDRSQKKTSSRRVRRGRRLPGGVASPLPPAGSGRPPSPPPDPAILPGSRRRRAIFRPENSM